MGERMCMPGNEPKRSGYNWKIIIPVGCLVLVVGTAALIGTAFFGVTRFVKTSDFHTKALAEVQASAEVADALGSPIEGGVPRKASFHLEGLSGEADAEIPIAGPNGTGILHAVGVKTGGKWEFTTLEVTIESTGITIGLLPSEAARASPVGDRSEVRIEGDQENATFARAAIGQ